MSTGENRVKKFLSYLRVYMNVGDGNQAVSLGLIHWFCPSFIYGYETNDESKIY